MKKRKKKTVSLRKSLNNGLLREIGSVFINDLRSIREDGVEVDVDFSKVPSFEIPKFDPRVFDVPFYTGHLTRKELGAFFVPYEDLFDAEIN